MGYLRDHVERCWAVIDMPGGICNVPVPDEVALEGPDAMRDYAHRQLRKSCWPGAPVEKWPMVATRYCSRDDLNRKRSK